MSRGEMRATRVEILTTDSEFAEIVRALDAKRRKGTATVEISIDALRHLHADHLTLMDGLRSRKLLGLILGADQRSIEDLVGSAPQ